MCEEVTRDWREFH